jgi:hypothetical protein
LLVIGIALIAMFIYWQSVFKHPLMPLHVWQDRNFALPQRNPLSWLLRLLEQHFLAGAFLAADRALLTAPGGS